MIVAGVDIGNTTTEVVLAEVAADSVTTLAARRALTAGPKGSDDSIRGAARLVLSAERALGERSEILLLPPLHPVITLSASLPTPPGRASPLRRLDDTSAGTPAGRGYVVGAHLPLRDIADLTASSDSVVLSVPRGTDFEEAAARIATAQDMELPIAAAVVAGDDAVLIANRIPRAIPIVDEAEVGGLPTGELIAVEVAEPGGRVRVLSDAVALVAAFGLAPAQAALLSEFALSLSDARSAAVALSRGATPATEDRDFGWLDYDGDAGVCRAPLSRRLAEHVASIRPGSVRTAHIPRGAPLHDALGDAGERVRDVFAVDLPSIREHFFPRQGSIELDEVPFSALVLPASTPSPPEEALAQATGRPVRVMPSEAEAAALGALTTPGAPPDAAVCDMGGGTLDVVWGDRRLTAAGAGELLTVSIATALSLQIRLAEHVKRVGSFRAEAPHIVRYEDGNRSFVEQGLRADSLGSLCFMRGTTPVPFSDRLAPEEWRSLRLAIKRHVIGANVGRCMKWLGGTPHTLLLCGGAALDAESVRIVSEALRAQGTTVGRANVGGAHGPRYGVALGLVLAFRAPAKCGG
jgi:hypothetical protein